MIRPPETSDYAPYYQKYVSLVQGDDLTRLLEAQLGDTFATLRGINEQKSMHRYEPGKWSLKEVMGHLTDAERIFSYRALRFGRGDQTALPGFEQDDYVAAANTDARAWSDLVAEFEHVRRATILLFQGFNEEAALRTGTASNASVSVRALGYIIAGHELHHMKIVRERYL
jgi:DinB family protein